MTSENIDEHTKSKLGRQQEKEYLKGILKHETLLSAKTKFGVYSKLFDLYFKEEEFRSAEELAKDMGKQGKPLLEKLFISELERSLKVGYLYGAPEVVKKLIGINKSKGEEYMGRIINGFVREGNLPYAEKLTDYISNGDEVLMDAYIKFGILSGAEQIAERTKSVRLLEIYKAQIKQGEDGIKKYEQRIKEGNGIGGSRVMEGLIEDEKKKIEKIRNKLQHKEEGLISRLSSFIAITGVLGGIFFLSTNITGNAIANISTKTTSLLGAGLLIVGLVAGLFYLKKR